MAKREGIWASDPDIRAFRQLVEDLPARETAPASPKGHRFGIGLTGGAYYRDVELWAQTPRPDIVAFRKLIEELRQRQQAETEERFVTRLRARLAEVASLPITDRRRAIGGRRRIPRGGARRRPGAGADRRAAGRLCCRRGRLICYRYATRPKIVADLVL